MLIGAKSNNWGQVDYANTSPIKIILHFSSNNHENMDRHIPYFRFNVNACAVFAYTVFTPQQYHIPG